MKDTRLKIGIDLDGVLANFIAEYRKVCSQVSGRILPTDQVDWDASNWELTKAQHDEAWKIITATDNFYANLKPLESCIIEKVKELADKYRLYFITTRPPTAGWPIENQSAWWIEYFCNLRFPTVIVSKEKGQVAAALGLDAFLDDAPANIENVAKYSPKTKLFLRDQQYNRSFDGEYTRVFNFNEFVSEIDRMLENDSTGVK